MKSEYYISISLDTRRALTDKRVHGKKKEKPEVGENSKYPVKLRVYTPSPNRKQKLYPTVFELSKKDYHSVWETVKPREQHKKLKGKMQALLVKAMKIADDLEPFSFEKFERKMFRKAGDGVNVEHQYKEIIRECIEQDRIGSMDAYEGSMKSISAYVEQRKSFHNLTLYEITPQWLREYEKYMIEDAGNTRTTVGIYLRQLRAVFNKAIEEGEIDREYYPFGKRKYIIPSGKNTKKALSPEQLGLLYNATAGTPEQDMARDFWFFSYACSGMNVKDIALLRYRNISDGIIQFYREKTKNTTKDQLKPIVVHLNSFSQGVIDKYGNVEISPSTLVFNIINDSMSNEVQRSKVKAFTRFINQHIKKLCLSVGLPKEVSVYWARHSYATKIIRDGASMEFAQEHLGHSSLKTTQNYFAGFDNDTKKEFSEKIMNFGV